MSKSSNRNSFMDLYRFLAMFVVMGCHQYHLSVAGFPFYHGWIFAEFFFILTGYLTASHFHLTASQKGIIRTSLRYTLHKFLSMAVFIWSAILLEYVYQALRMWLFADASFKDILTYFAQLPIELLMLCGLFAQPVLIPAWYLSALFIVFPLFCILLQVLPKKILTFTSAALPIICYLIIGFAGNWTLPDNLIRALAGLFLGTFAFRMNQDVLPKVYDILGKLLLTILQMICLAAPLLLSISDPRPWIIPILVCFVLGIAITMSEASYTGAIKSRFLVYLGKISLPLYLFHWTVASVLCSHRLPFTSEQRYIIFHVVSILVAIFAYEALRFVKRSINKRCVASEHTIS